MTRRIKRYKVLTILLVALLVLGLLTGCKKKVKDPKPTEQTEVQEASEEEEEAEVITEPEEEDLLDEDGYYYSKDEVALYIHIYGHLPDNFMTKKEAKNLGWSGGSLENYAPGKVIGGDRFGNYEGNLPDGKKYTECDIDTYKKKKRGAKRIVFSDDGYIYYTEDHYESFELLYEPDGN